MEKDCIFAQAEYKNNKINIRRRIIGKSIAGLFLQNNIRFYYDSSIYEKVKDRDVRRLLRAWSEDFKVVDNSIDVKVKECELIKKYNLKDGVIVLYTPHYFDIIPYENLKDYLKDFCYSDGVEEKVKRNRLLLLKRNIDNIDDINFQLKGLD